MSVIDIAKSHFENIGVQSMEVPEWTDQDGKAVVIYWNPITLSEKNRLLKKSDTLNDVAILADIMIMKALDKDGNKVFKLEDKITLMHKSDPDVLTRIAQKMVSAPTTDELKKIKNIPEIRNLLTLADRLKITLHQILQMEVWEYNHWLAYLSIEADEHNQAINKAKYK